jgi:hypothetical protein
MINLPEKNKKKHISSLTASTHAVKATEEFLEFCKWFRGLPKDESDKILSNLKDTIRKEEAKLN